MSGTTRLSNKILALFVAVVATAAARVEAFSTSAPSFGVGSRQQQQQEQQQQQQQQQQRFVQHRGDTCLFSTATPPAEPTAKKDAAEAGAPPATSEASTDTTDAEIPTNLPSDCGMDYIPLATMLATGQLAEADQVRLDVDVVVVVVVSICVCLSCVCVYDCTSFLCFVAWTITTVQIFPTDK